MAWSQLTIAIAWSLLLMLQSSSPHARTLNNHRHNHRHKISFLMQDVLNLNGSLPSKPATSKDVDQLPFSKPRGFFPPDRGIPMTQTVLDKSSVSNMGGLSFLDIATLDELELGTVTVIDEVLVDSSVSGSRVIGKAQGMYVASSGDGNSHMMALTASFDGKGSGDGLRFFGVHRSDVPESHVAVIGGTGKFGAANGYATVKSVLKVRQNGAKKLVHFIVYLS